MALTARAQATPRTSVGVTISMSSSAAAAPRRDRSAAGRVARHVDDDRVQQPVGVLQPARQVEVDRSRAVADLDAHQAGRERPLEHAGHLEPAEAELAGPICTFDWPDR